MPKDDDIDDIDIGIDAEDIATKGMEAGVKSGVRQGIKEGIKPFAQKAGEDAVKNIMSGGDPIDKTLDQINKMVKTQTLQAYAENLKKSAMSPTPAPVQNAAADPAQQLMSTLAVLQQMGVNPATLTDKIGINTLLSLINPQLAPLMLLMMQQGKNQNQPQQNSQSELLPLLVMLMQNNQKHDAPVQQSSGNELLIAMMNQQSALQQKIFELQSQAAQFQQQALMEQIKPYLNQSHPSFTDELEGMKVKIEAFKGLGLFGSNAPNNQTEAEFELRKTQMAMDLKREQMRMDHETTLSDRQEAAKVREQEQWNQIITTAGNFMKNLNLEQLMQKPAPQAQVPPSTEQNMPTNVPSGAPGKQQVPLSNQITQKINDMLRVQSIRKAEPIENQSEDNE